MDRWIHSHFPDLPTIRNWIKENANVDIRIVNKWIEQHKLVSTMLLALFVFLVGSFFFGKKRRKLPPGPIGLPFIGYLPYMTRYPHVKLEELRKKYGNIFSIPLGSRNVIVLGTFDLIKEALSKQEFYGRPKENPFFSDDSGIGDIFSGATWKEHRKHLLQFIRNFGTEKTRVEENAAVEISRFVKRLEEFSGRPIKFPEILSPSISNIICTLVFGKSYPYDDPERRSLDANLKNMCDSFSKTFILFFFPTVRRILKMFRWRYMIQIKDAVSRLQSFMTAQIKRHKGSLDEDIPSDYMDTYLVEINKNKNKAENTFSESALLDMSSAFFIAGSETTRSTLEWVFLTMAAFPEVQKRVVAEIDEIIGKDRQPIYTDVQNMPYTQAVIMEVMRWKSIGPIGSSRTLEDIEISGYFIPKDSLVFTNMWAVHRSPDNWLLPEVFRPERFLSEDGKQIVKHEAFMPFGIGKRACPGEALAKAQVFMYFASILQKMTVKPYPGGKLDFTEELGLGLIPRRADIMFVKRNS